MQQLKSWDDSGLPVTQTNNPIAACRRLLGRIMRLIWEGTAVAEGYRRRHFASHGRWLWFGQVKPLKQPGGGAAQETRDSFHVGSQTDRRKQLFSFDYVKVSLCLVSWRAKSKCMRTLLFPSLDVFDEAKQTFIGTTPSTKLQRRQIRGFQSWNLASPACQAPVKGAWQAGLVSRELIGILSVATQAELSRIFALKKTFFPGSSNSRKWEILKFNSEQYADCSSSHRARSKCFPRAFSAGDCVKYTQVVQERFHSGEFCAGLSCTLVLPALRSNEDPEASLRTALWTELPSLSKTQKVTTNCGRKYKHFKQAQVGVYWEAVKKKRKKNLISSHLQLQDPPEGKRCRAFVQ